MIEKFEIDIQCRYCGGVVAGEGEDTYWICECQKCGMGVAGKSREDVIKPFESVHNPVVTDRQEMEEI